MEFTPVQLTTLKNAINAETDPSFVEFRNNGQTTAMSGWFNTQANPTFNVWRTDTPATAILDAINWPLYTLAGDLSDSTLLLALTAQQRSTQLLAVQTKQMNLQLMLVGRSSLDTSKVNVRTGLRDAVIQVPAGVNGANVSPGGSSGAAVLAACIRPATRLEKLFAAASQGSDTTGSTVARVMVLEGFCSSDDIVNAINS